MSDMQLKVYEMHVSVYTLREMDINKTQAAITHLIDSSFMADYTFCRLHNNRGFKGYSYSNLTPRGVFRDGKIIFEAGKIYKFRIRSVSKNMVTYLKKVLFTAITDDFKVLDVNYRVVPREIFTEFYSLTPVTVSLEEGNYWQDCISVEEYIKLLQRVLINGYNQICRKDLPLDTELFSSLEFTKNKAIPVKYKDVIWLTDKVRVIPANSSVAQEVMYFAIGCGLGMKCSRGFGFLEYKY